jgi:hypothetical protein
MAKAKTKTKTKTKAKTKTKTKTKTKLKAKAKVKVKATVKAKSRTFEQVLAPYPDGVQLIAQQTRTSVRELLPESIETVDGSGPYISYGSTTGYKGIVCTIIVSKGGVKLGLTGGASLADPDQLLEGSGKVHRYIAMKSVDDLRRPEVLSLIRAAESRSRS